jgi:hypothetical protein
LLKQLKDLKIEVPILIHTISGLPIDMAVIPDNQEELENGNHMSVVYELPVTWDEVLCRHAAEVEGDPLELLKAQVYVCDIYTYIYICICISIYERMRRKKELSKLRIIKEKRHI